MSVLGEQCSSTWLQAKFLECSLSCPRAVHPLPAGVVTVLLALGPDGQTQVNGPLCTTPIAGLPGKRSVNCKQCGYGRQVSNCSQN